MHFAYDCDCVGLARNLVRLEHARIDRAHLDISEKLAERSNVLVNGFVSSIAQRVRIAAHSLPNLGSLREGLACHSQKVSLHQFVKCLAHGAVDVINCVLIAILKFTKAPYQFMTKMVPIVRSPSVLNLARNGHCQEFFET